MLFDLDGHCLAKAADYTVKLVRNQFLQSSQALSPYHVIEFVKDTRPNEFSIITDEELPVIVIADSETDKDWPVSGNIIPLLRTDGMLDFPSMFDMFSRDYKNGIKGIVLLPSNQHISSEIALDEGHPDQPAVEFFQLIKALLNTKLRCQSGCLVITPNGFSVTKGAGEIVPKMHALAALARIARMENPQLNICVIDDDRFSLAELNSYFPMAPKHDIWINRNGQRYLEKLSNLTAPQHDKINVNREGVYVITGGLGALGLAFAGHLSSKGQINIALLGSSEFPDKHLWGTLIDNENTNLSLKQKILAINAIESTGSIVDYYRVDVSDRQNMSDCLDSLRQNHLKINGVIHAAGRAGEGFIFSKSQETFSRVVTPKILGAQNLHVLTESDDLDFFILFSSVATVLRSPGQSDYTAANSYLDALAIARRAKGLKAHSICWPAWSEIGIAVEYNAVNVKEFFSPIATVVGLRLIEPLFDPKNNLPPVIVISEINRNAQLSDIESLGIQLGESIKGVFKKHAQQKGVDHNSDLSEVIVHGAEGSAVLTAVAKRWQSVLGVDEFNIDDSFSELGGNSILTTQLYQEFELKYPGVFDVVDLFTYTTLRDQRDHLERAINKGHENSNESSSTPSIDVDWMDDESLDHILAALESGSLSADDAHQLLG
jgi:polyketide synthase PksN